jgi:hypothetical protein
VGLQQWAALDAASALKSRNDPYLPNEQFADAPSPVIADVCDFIGVRMEGPSLEACTDLAWPNTHRTRDSPSWTGNERSAVDRLFGRYEVLMSNSFVLKSNSFDD